MKQMATTVKKVRVPVSGSVAIQKTIMCDLRAIHSATAPNKAFRNSRTKSSIIRKIAGYRQQDTIRHRGTGDNVTFQDVISKLVSAQGCCAYCDVHLVLSGGEKRNGLQWSLDRINNKLGHSDTNTVVSCLACNLRRRSRPHANFLAGAKMKFVKIC